MMKIQELRELIKLVSESNLDEFVYEEDDAKIKMKKKNQKADVIAVEPEVKTQKIIEEPVQTSAPSPTPVNKTEVVEKEKTVDIKEEKASATDVDTEDLHKITSPMVGTFYQAPSPESDPYVKVGTHIEPDTIVCIVEAMKLFNEIEADVEGEIVEVLVEDGQLVEYGQPLFLVKTK